jgi:hypothetical protein
MYVNIHVHTTHMSIPNRLLISHFANLSQWQEYPMNKEFANRLTKASTNMAVPTGVSAVGGYDDLESAPIGGEKSMWTCVRAHASRYMSHQPQRGRGQDDFDTAAICSGQISGVMH